MNLFNHLIFIFTPLATRSGCSAFAAGIWTIKFPEDDTGLWMKEIMELGEYLNDQEWAKANLKEQMNEATNRFVAIMDRPGGPRPDAVIRRIQEIMVPWKVGYIRNEERLKTCLPPICNPMNRYQSRRE